MLLRAAVAAAFGTATIFWQEPTVAVMAVAGGLYFLLSGFAVWALSRVPGMARARKLLLFEAALLTVAGIFALVVPTAVGFSIAAILALGVAGLLELALWKRHRQQLEAMRDWLVTGVVGVVTALIIALFVQLQAHALLGVTGGAAIIIAVLLGIAGLGYRHDAAGEAVKA